MGNRAVARLVAQRYTAPVKPPPSQAPGFRKVRSDVAAKKQKVAQHPPATAESQAAQDAAVAPPDDKEAQGKAANAEKMHAAKPGTFDKAAFVAAVNAAIAKQAPKNLDEADKFSDSGKADRVKEEVDGKVSDGKKTSAQEIETTTKAPPDTSAAKDKPVTPLTPDRPPAQPRRAVRRRRRARQTAGRGHRLLPRPGRQRQGAGRCGGHRGAVAEGQ
ncbi:hypothetical protein [Streptomyces pactum]|uniref:hypothetical protein n=1 Tax=Streptomyces pactum TaxID=68249 RepID=UPI001E2E8553|nr:hypothetical protein [Streptomyces pactum]